MDWPFLEVPPLRVGDEETWEFVQVRGSRSGLMPCYEAPGTPLVCIGICISIYIYIQMCVYVCIDREIDR